MISVNIFGRKWTSTKSEASVNFRWTGMLALLRALFKIQSKREFFIDNLLVRIHFIIEMIWWTGLAPWESEFPFPGSLICTFPVKSSQLPISFDVGSASGRVGCRTLTTIRQGYLAYKKQPPPL